MSHHRTDAGREFLSRSTLFKIKKGAGAVCLALAVLMLSGGCSPFHSPHTAGEPDSQHDTTLLSAEDTLQCKEVEEHLTFAGPEEIKAYMKSSPSATRYSLGILPAMADAAPKYAEALLNSKYPRFLIADKGSMRVIVYDSLGVELRSFKMAAGKNYGTKHKRRDCRTPEGLFSVEGVYNSTEWLFTDDDGNTSQVKGQFGPRFIRLLIPTTRQIGIHGTCAPWSVGGRRSHGCMRLRNEDILELVAMVDSGMPVIVNPSWRDMKVNEQEGYHIPKVKTGYADMTQPRQPSATSDEAPAPTSSDSTPDTNHHITDTVSRHVSNAHEHPTQVPDSTAHSI